MIVDQFGNPLKPQARPETRMVAAATLRDRWSSYPTVGLTPLRLTQIFQEADQGYLAAQAELFEEMEEKDAHLASLLQTRKSAVLGLEWRIEPASDEAKDIEIAGFVEERLRDLPCLEDALLDLLDAVGKGYSLVEIDWRVDRWAEPVFLRWVHPKRVTFWNSLTPGLTNDYALDGKPLLPWKFIFHRYRGRSGHDTRSGMLRVISWMYLLKNHAMKDWAVFNEVFGMPMRLGKYDVSASQTDRDALVTAIRNLGSDAAGIISKSTEIEFVETATRLTGSFNPYQVMADFCNREMSKAILGQTLTTDTSGGTGTFAAGKVHDEVRRDLVEADAESLAVSLRAQLIRPLVGFNFGWEKNLPYFVFNLEEEQDLKNLAETYKIIHEIDSELLTREHLAETFGIPFPEPGQQMIDGQAQPEKGQETEAGTENRDETEEREEATVPAKAFMTLRSGEELEITRHDKPVLQAQQEMDALTRAALEASEAAAEQMLAPVRELIAAGGADLAIVKERLLEAYGDLDTQDLEEALYQATVLAALRGHLEGAGQ